MAPMGFLWGGGIPVGSSQARQATSLPSYMSEFSSIKKHSSVKMCREPTCGGFRALFGGGHVGCGFEIFFF